MVLNPHNPILLNVQEIQKISKTPTHINVFDFHKPLLNRFLILQFVYIMHYMQYHYYNEAMIFEIFSVKWKKCVIGKCIV